MTLHDDRTAIADLVHGYALHIRRGEPARAADLFTDDARFEVRQMDPLAPESVSISSRVEGRAAIAAYVGNSTSGVRMIPAIHNLIIELAGDEATATSLMIGMIWPTPNEVVGEYSDRFRRERDGWRFAERVYTIWRKPQG